MRRRSRICVCLSLFVFIVVVSSLDLLGVDEKPTPSPREKSWQVLDEGLSEASAPKRVEAVKALSIISGERHAVSLAVRRLTDDNFRVRAAAATTLGQLHATSAIPQLKIALSDTRTSVVLAAAQALFILHDKSAYGIYYAVLMGDKKTSDGMIQAQMDRLKDPKQMAELGLQEGMGFVPYGGIGYEAYRNISKKDNWPVRAAAARFLAHDPDPMSRDALIQTALADDNTNVRHAALDALAERGDATCIDRLMRNLDDDKHDVRYRTAAVIIHLSDVAHLSDAGDRSKLKEKEKEKDKPPEKPASSPQP